MHGLFLSFFDWLWWLLRAASQIAVLALAVYYVYGVIRKGTRGVQILTGIGTIALVYLLVWTFNLSALKSILPNIRQSLPIFLCILFQPELRKLFAGIVDRRNFSASETGIDATIEIFVKTASILSSQRVGALIALERGESLAPYELQGTSLKAPIVQDLLLTIFFPKTPLHDGAVIIRNGLISAAGCIFPVAMGDGKRNYGTRHRAALGLTSETDALVIVVSEETGKISIADHGILDRGPTHAGLTPEELRVRLHAGLQVSESDLSNERMDPAQ